MKKLVTIIMLGSLCTSIHSMDKINPQNDRPRRPQQTQYSALLPRTQQKVYHVNSGGPSIRATRLPRAGLATLAITQLVRIVQDC